MADKKTYADVLSEGKIGTYKEAPGGGTPLSKGQKAPDKAWVAAHRKPQPRDEEGHFTYNSANGKELEYGPSRGVTIPPFLKGVRMTYAQKTKKGDRILSNQNGKKNVYISDLDFTADEMIEAFREYKKNGVGFGDFSKEIQRKKGRLSKREKLTKTVSIIDPNVANQQMQSIWQHYKANQKQTSYARRKAAQNQTIQPVSGAGQNAQPVSGAGQNAQPVSGAGQKTIVNTPTNDKTGSMKQGSFFKTDETPKNETPKNETPNSINLSFDDLFSDSSQDLTRKNSKTVPSSRQELVAGFLNAWKNRK